MRASSLSNDKVIDLLNKHFVSVYLSNEDYHGDGPAPPEERKELSRIIQETHQAKRSAGSVHVYILAPDGKAADSMHVASAAKVEKLTEMLETNIERLGVQPGPVVVPPSPQSHAPKARPGELVLHVVARNAVKKGDELVPTKSKLGETRSIGWGSYPAENWVVLSAEEVAKLLPRGKGEVGAKWDVDPSVAERVLTYFYPSTENNDVRKNKIEKAELRATVVSAKEGVVRVRLDGKLLMQHSFYHKDDGNRVEADLAGYLDFDPAGRRVTSLRLVTTDATYAKRPFGVALRSLP